MRIAVAGGSGTVGRLVCALLADAGHEPVTLSRSNGYDLTSPRDAVRGVAGCVAIIDVSNVVTTRRGPSMRFFTAVTDNLVTAARSAGITRHTLLSIVGIDRIDAGYYSGKLRQEALLASSGLDVRVLRATQFHEFAGQMLDRLSIGPLALIPDLQTAPVAAAEVAAHLVDLTLSDSPPGYVELGGPEVLRVTDMARRLSRLQGRSPKILPARLPGRRGRLLRSGALLPGDGARRGSQTFDQWLESIRHQAAKR